MSSLSSGGLTNDTDLDSDCDRPFYGVYLPELTSLCHPSSPVLDPAGVDSGPTMMENMSTQAVVSHRDAAVDALPAFLFEPPPLVFYTQSAQTDSADTCDAAVSARPIQEPLLSPPPVPVSHVAAVIVELLCGRIAAPPPDIAMEALQRLNAADMSAPQRAALRLAVDLAVAVVRQFNESLLDSATDRYLSSANTLGVAIAPEVLRYLMGEIDLQRRRPSEPAAF
jgi:hypothetical protein